VDYVIPGNDDALRAIRLFTSKISESIAEGAQLMTDKQIADMSAATAEAQAAEDAAASEYAGDESGAIDASEDLTMEEVLGGGTQKKPVANEDADLPKVESQTV
jgi:small subunit ribosomal protein S2